MNKLREEKIDKITLMLFLALFALGIAGPMFMGNLKIFFGYLGILLALWAVLRILLKRSSL